MVGALGVIHTNFLASLTTKSFTRMRPTIAVPLKMRRASAPQTQLKSLQPKTHAHVKATTTMPRDEFGNNATRFTSARAKWKAS